MANSKEYVIQLSVDGQGAISNIDKVNESIAKTENVTKSAKAQLRELNNQLSTLEQGSEEFQKLSEKAGELRDQINDASEAIRANAGNAFEVIGNNVDNLGNQFLSLDFDGIAQSFNGIGAAVGNIKFDDITKGVGKIGTALGNVGKALLTNPIFLIGAAIAAAIVYADELLTLVDGVTDAEMKALDIQQQRADLAKKQADDVSNTEESLKRQGLTEKEIRNLKLQQLEVAIQEQEAAVKTGEIIRKNQVEAAERNANLTRAVIRGGLEIANAMFRAVALPFDGLIAAANKVSELLGFGKAIDFSINESISNLNAAAADKLTKMLFDPEQVRADAEKANAEAVDKLKALKNQRDGILNRIDAENQQRAENNRTKSKANTEREAQERNNILVKANEDRIKKEDEQFELQQSLVKDKQEKEIDDLVAAYDKKFEIAAGNAELEKQLQEQLQADLKAITDKYAQEALVNEKAKQDAIVDINKKSDEQILEDKRKLEQTKMKLAADAFTAIGDLISSFQTKDERAAKKQFQIAKAFNLAAAITNTAMAVTAALSGGGNAAKVATSQNFVEAAIAGAVGLAQIAKIAATKFNSGGGGGGSNNVPSGGGGGGGGGGGTSPVFNPINLDFLKNRPQQAIPAYVLSGAVTNAQVADQQIQDKSRL